MIAPETLLLQHKNLRNLLYGDSIIDFFNGSSLLLTKKTQIETALHSKAHLSSLVITSALQFSFFSNFMSSFHPHFRFFLS